MNWKKSLSIVLAAVMFTSLILRVDNQVYANEFRTIEDESIYDILIDRFFNGSGTNDEDANAKDPTAFNGGDFNGVLAKKDFIKNMGYTIVSLGNVFETNTYDGSEVTSFTKLESHFGTEEELQAIIQAYHKSAIRIMVDFPVDLLSTEHEWFSANEHADWIVSTDDQVFQLDGQNKQYQEALKDALRNFLSAYNVDIRLTNIENMPTSFLNELIDLIKESKKDRYVISNAVSDAKFDAKYDESMVETQRNVFKSVDQSTEQLLAHIDSNPPTIVMVDSIWSDRFVKYSELYPPTRVKMAVLTSLLIPGVPMIQYGTEIAMNGSAGTDAHQLYNFKTDSELIEQIKNIQTLRNSSATLRNGDFEVIKNEDGYVAFTRTSDTEQWLVVINNTSKTKTVELTEALIGKGKKITALLDTETIRADKNGVYHVVLDREMIELYQIKEDTGINTSYLIALGLVYILFTIFVVMIVKRGRKRRAEDATISK